MEYNGRGFCQTDHFVGKRSELLRHCDCLGLNLKLTQDEATIANSNEEDHYYIEQVRCI